MFVATGREYVFRNSTTLFGSTDRGANWTALRPPLAYAIAVAIDPVTPTIVYVLGATVGACDSRGFCSEFLTLARTTDGGSSWDSSTVGSCGPVCTGGSLALDSMHPSTVYLVAQGGVFKSVDAGVTWDPAGPNLAAVSALTIDPRTPATLYAATADGVFRSTNGGSSWDPINAGLTSLSVDTVGIDATMPATLYAGTDGGGVFKSTNGGTSWAATNAGLVDPQVRALAIDPVTSDTIYALTSSGLFQSSDGGQGWSGVNRELTRALPIGALASDPRAGATLYAAPAIEHRVWRSTDGGGTWAPVGTPPVFGSFPLSMLVMDPTAPRTVYALRSGVALYRSADGGATWATMASAGLDLYVSALAIDAATPSTLYAGTRLNGVFKSTDSGATWISINTGLPTHPVFPAFPDVNVNVLTTDLGSPGTVFLGSVDRGVFKSTDGGASWMAANTGLDQRVSDLKIDSRTGRLYAVTQAGVFTSGDRGASWVAAVTELAGAPIRALEVDPITPATVYAGTTGAGVFKSTDEGASWQPVNTGLPSLEVRGLAVDATNLYASMPDGRLFQWALVTPPPPTAPPTTTTLPCATSRCLLDAARTSAACDDRPLPRVLTTRIDKAVRFIEAAAGSRPRRARTLRKAARRLLRRVEVGAVKASKRKKPKLSPDCAATLRATARRVRGDLEATAPAGDRWGRARANV